MAQSHLVQVPGAELGGDVSVLLVHGPARLRQHASIETGAAVAEQLLLQTSLEDIVSGLGDTLRAAQLASMQAFARQTRLYVVIGYEHWP